MLPQIDGICVLVVDDEEPARQRLVDLLQADPMVKTILEAKDGLSAVAMIEERKPRLVFLDVQMPELDGLGVMEAVGPQSMPLTVFVTAYDQHALWAFEANALDYLLKPFSDERFAATLARVRERLDEQQVHHFSQRLIQLLASAPQAMKPIDRLVVKSGGVTRFIRVVDIERIEAAGVYVTLHGNHLSPRTGKVEPEGSEILYRSSLTDLADRLDPARFIRVHRSTLVNIESIVQLEPISHGECEILLKSGARTRLSRSYRPLLEQRLGQSL